MSRDILEELEPFLSEDRRSWAKLASDVGYRRLHLLLLREILVELRELNSGAAEGASGRPGNGEAGE